MAWSRHGISQQQNNRILIHRQARANPCPQRPTAGPRPRALGNDSTRSPEPSAVPRRRGAERRRRSKTPSNSDIKHHRTRAHSPQPGSRVFARARHQKLNFRIALPTRNGRIPMGQAGAGCSHQSIDRPHPFPALPRLATRLSWNSCRSRSPHRPDGRTAGSPAVMRARRGCDRRVTRSSLESRATFGRPAFTATSALRGTCGASYRGRRLARFILTSQGKKGRVCRAALETP